MPGHRWHLGRVGLSSAVIAVLVAVLPGAAVSAPPAASAGASAAVSGLRDLAVVPAAKACADLLTGDYTGIPGAPTKLDSATVVPAGPGVPQPYCDVKGYVASAVHFEVKLPISGWTQRFLMLGCGGYCGFVSTAPPAAATYGCAPVTSGEMVLAATDLGHVRGGQLFADGMWALGNPGAVADFAYLGMHKTTLAAKALIKSFYNRGPRYSYYVGCSDGGREGLHEVQRYPDDYDGVVAGAPVIDEVATNTFYHAWNVRVNSRPDGRAILTADKIPALHQAVLDACGANAGGQGDMIQDPRACDLDARTLVCAGADAPTCLTPAQADVVNKLWSGPVDRHGVHLSAGDMPYGSELSWIGTMVPADPNAILSPTTVGDAQWSYDFPNYMARFDAPTGITYQNIQFTRREFAYLHQLTGIYDPTNPDLRRFAARGGKLLLWTGAADSGASPYMVLNYYDAVRRTLGIRAANRFMTLYMAPGVYHCGAGPTPARADYLTPLMQWTETGTHPDRVVVQYLTGPTDATVAKTRPVFPYPAIAHYTGTGSKDDAANYVKAPPVQLFTDRYPWAGLTHYTASHTRWYVPGTPRLSTHRPSGS